MTRSTTSSISTAITSLPPSTEPSARKRSRSGPRSLVPRLPHRAGDISPFAIIGRQVDGAPNPVPPVPLVETRGLARVYDVGGQTVTSLIDVDLAVVPLSRVADCLES